MEENIVKQAVAWLTTLKKECPVCEGSGEIPCDCNENNERECPNCKGKGVIPKQKTATQKMELPCDHPQCRNGKVTCGSCNGTGLTPQGEPCPDCKGSGQVNCPVCKGLGRMERVKQESWIEHETCHVCNGRGVVDCYYCHGTKKRACPDCKGKGTVLDKGKIAVIAVLSMLLMAIPVLFIAVALIALGGLGFTVWKNHNGKDEEPAVEFDDTFED